MDIILDLKKSKKQLYNKNKMTKNKTSIQYLSLGGTHMFCICEMIYIEKSTIHHVLFDIM